MVPESTVHDWRDVIQMITTYKFVTTLF